MSQRDQTLVGVSSPAGTSCLIRCVCVCVCALTALGDSSRCGQVSVLSVHVVGAAPRVVTQPDTKVLHLLRGFLMDLHESNNSRASLMSH